MIYDFITNMYFTGITQWYIIQTLKAKEPEIFRGFWLFFALASILRRKYIWNTRFLIVYQVFMVR